MRRMNKGLMYQIMDSEYVTDDLIQQCQELAEDGYEPDSLYDLWDILEINIEDFMPYDRERLIDNARSIWDI